MDPGGFEFSPDDQHIAYLHAHLPKDVGADKNWMLFVMDVQSGTRHACFDPSSLPKCGEASVAGLMHTGMGVTRYHWASATTSPSRLLVPQPEAAYVVDVAKINQSTEVVGDGTDRPQTTYISPARCVVRSTPEFPALDVSISPDGEWIAFVRDSEIHVAPTTATGFETKCVRSIPGVRGGSTEMQVPTSTRVTHGAQGRTFVSHGLAEFVAAEEMRRDRGLWWHPDSSKIAFTRVDSSNVSLVDVRAGACEDDGNEFGHVGRRGAVGPGIGPGIGPSPLPGPGIGPGAQVSLSDPGRGTDQVTGTGARVAGDAPDNTQVRVEQHSYPFVGETNARVTLGVVDVSPVTKAASGGSKHGNAGTQSGDPNAFAVTWLDLDCGGAKDKRVVTTTSAGDLEEYLCSVTWVTARCGSDERGKHGTTEKPGAYFPLTTFRRLLIAHT